MLDDCIHERPPTASRRWRCAFLVLIACPFATTPLAAQENPLSAISIGAGVRTAYMHTDIDQEDVDSVDRFLLDSIRIYVNGPVSDVVKFTFNTEYEGTGNRVTVLDAVARFEMSEKFNVWAGRLLPPSDRANLYGPYYAHHWSVFNDGVQDGYPFVATGRDNGVVYWGQYGKVKVQAGGFDGPSATGKTTILGAGRVMVNFWDPEPGYYLNGTYYGDKNILAIGAAAQVQGSDRNAYNVDFLLERKAGSAGSFSIEAEWAKYDQLGGYNSQYTVNDGGYVLGSYLFPKKAGAGQFEILGKFGEARFRRGLTPDNVDYSQKTTELNLNYVMKQFNSRLMIFYVDKRFDAVQSNSKQVGVGVQLQL